MIICYIVTIKTPRMISADQIPILLTVTRSVVCCDSTRTHRSLLVAKVVKIVMNCLHHYLAKWYYYTAPTYDWRLVFSQRVDTQSYLIDSEHSTWVASDRVTRGALRMSREIGNLGHAKLRGPRRAVGDRPAWGTHVFTCFCIDVTW